MGFFFQIEMDAITLLNPHLVAPGPEDFPSEVKGSSKVIIFIDVYSSLVCCDCFSFIICLCFVIQIITYLKPSINDVS